MAVKKYIALQDGYVDGRIVKAGETFETDFRELVREKPDPRNPKAVPAIKRDQKTGEAVTKNGKAPKWARLADENEAEDEAEVDTEGSV